MSRGIYILALGHSSYAQWAVNLAASVKYYSPLLHITLLHDGGAVRLPENEAWLFDNIIEIAKEDYTDKKGMFQPGKAKLNLYKYFNHKENLFIDADSICINELDSVFYKCKDINVGLQVYNIANSKDTWACKWATYDQLDEFYKVSGEVPEINSSIIYSKKNKEAEKFWKQAAYNFIENFESLWGTRFPDELGFNAAAAKMKYDIKIPTSGDHYPIAMTCDINGERLGIQRLKDIAPVMSYWGGKSGKYISHYKNYDLQAKFIHKTVLGKQNPYKYDNLVKDKLVVRDGVRLNVKPQIKKYEK
jgi:hypothetical protein